MEEMFLSKLYAQHKTRFKVKKSSNSKTDMERVFLIIHHLSCAGLAPDGQQLPNFTTKILTIVKVSMDSFLISG